VDPLATAEDLASYLQHDLDTATADLALAAASALVRRNVDWPISRVTETLTRLGNGSCVLTLPTLVLVEVTAIRLAGGTLTPATVDAVGALDARDYVWTSQGQVVRLAGWPRLAPVEVDCTHGYDPVPDDVRLVVMAVAGRLISNPERLRSETVGALSRAFDFRAPTELEAGLLDGYRLL
jgi:hypothetical protein